MLLSQAAFAGRPVGAPGTKPLFRGHLPLQELAVEEPSAEAPAPTPPARSALPRVRPPADELRVDVWSAPVRQSTVREPSSSEAEAGSLPADQELQPREASAEKQPGEAVLPENLPLLAANQTSNPTAPSPPEDQLMPPDILRSPGPAAKTPTQSVTILLLRKLVSKGLLSQEEADEMTQQAEEEAAAAHAQTVALQDAVAHVQVAVLAAAPDPAVADAGTDAMRVTYIPETVKSEMRDQIKQDVLAQAKSERWAAPKLLPEWTQRIRLFGDVRIRGEYDAFPNGNDNTGAFPNFNAINTGAPFDIAGSVFSPQINVDQNRERIRLRVRIGAEADLGSGFSAGLRIATGDSNTPVSTNQSLGLANQGQGGMFSKFNIFLDRGFLKYELGRNDPDRNLTVTLGRFENPFFSTEAIWDEDVGFDGVAVLGKYRVAKGVTPFLSGGAFPVFNTDFNFGTNNPAKFKSTDKWLYAIQGGTDWQIKKDWHLKTAAAYYHFDNVEGQLSDPFVPLTASDQGNTDNTRPSFSQKGNTFFPLRRIIPTAANNFGTTNQFQFFGLATPFHEFALTGRLDYTRWEPYKFSLTGEYIKNLAFNGANIDRIAINNRGPDNRLGQVGAFEGGDTAWIVEAKFGHATLEKPWDWVLGVNYRYLESDAVVDAFTDSEFGGGGTNLQGYSLYGVLALSSRVSVGLRWMSAREIAGPPAKADVFQIDFNGRF